MQNNATTALFRQYRNVTSGEDTMVLTAARTAGAATVCKDVK